MKLTLLVISFLVPVATSSRNEVALAVPTAQSCFNKNCWKSGGFLLKIAGNLLRQ